MNEFLSGAAPPPRTQPPPGPIDLHWRTIVDWLGEAVTIEDSMERIVYANRAAAELWGFESPERLIAASADERARRVTLVSLDGRDLSLGDLPGRRALRGETPPPLVLGFRSPNGGPPRWSQAHTRPLRLDGATWAVSSFRDAPEIAAHQVQLERDHREVREILDGIADPFTVLDQDLRIRFINESSAAAIGLQPEQVIGKLASEVMPGFEQTSLYEAYQRVQRSQKMEVFTDFFAPLDRWYEVSIYPLPDGGLVSSSRDVTERKRGELLQEELARHEALRAEVTGALAQGAEPRQMLQRVADAVVQKLGVSFARIWTVDEQGKTLLLQASAGKYTHIDGRHRAVPIGQFKIGRIAAERKPHLTNDVLNDPWVSNPEWARREGMVSFAGYPLLVDDALVGVMAMFAQKPLASHTLQALAGISDSVAQGYERRRAELELEERARDLARSNSDLEQFAYVASHDLQEPLRMVSSYVQLLDRRYRGKLDADADDFIGFAVEGATRMQRLINDLLTYSRVGRKGQDLGPARMNAAVEVATRNLLAAITESGAQVTHDELPIVWGDEAQLVQLMQNLIGNAVKFRSEAPPRIHVSARREGNQWTFAVKDNGIGIESQYFERIFVIFQRLNPREQYPGTGIGLALCKKIVERHRGRIWVESAPGQGSTLFFTVPANRTESA